VFGTFIFNGAPPRDDRDVPFSQFVIDTWASFARTTNPTPSLDYLSARNYANTTMLVKAGGGWNPLNSAKPMLKALDWVGTQIPFKEGPQCKSLGYPLDYFLS
jgi:hypothetical protein